MGAVFGFPNRRSDLLHKFKRITIALASGVWYILAANAATPVALGKIDS
jgi:hypothetical protein